MVVPLLTQLVVPAYTKVEAVVVRRQNVFCLVAASFLHLLRAVGLKAATLVPVVSWLAVQAPLVTLLLV